MNTINSLDEMVVTKEVETNFAKKNFETSNLNMVTWLVLKGINYKFATRFNRLVMFYFEDSEQLRKEIDNFKSNYELGAFLKVLYEQRTFVRNLR